MIGRLALGCVKVVLLSTGVWFILTSIARKQEQGERTDVDESGFDRGN